MAVEAQISWWERALPFTYNGSYEDLAAAVQRFGVADDGRHLWTIKHGDTIWPRNRSLRHDLSINEYAVSLVNICRALGVGADVASYSFMYYDGYQDVWSTGSLVLLNHVVILQYIADDGEIGLRKYAL